MNSVWKDEVYTKDIISQYSRRQQFSATSESHKSKFTSLIDVCYIAISVEVLVNIGGRSDLRRGQRGLIRLGMLAAAPSLFLGGLGIWINNCDRIDGLCGNRSLGGSGRLCGIGSTIVVASSLSRCYVLSRRYVARVAVSRCHGS